MTALQQRGAGMADEAGVRSVLVVDDRDDVRSLLQLVLETLGHRVQVAADGASALEAVRRVRPDVVLVDLGLPDIDGFEVARRIRAEHGPGMRVVALTGSDDERTRHDAIAAGFDAHFTKPLQDEDLERLV
jgi:CheY-like chemotaxis protein